ncbi:cytochrome P450 3A4-like [Dermacentor albipictus]|uniref:cytochrome P450 3A4-like n=1 Tax=Dermacentor albipictus TaxID=60249 RepID=UPI0038FCE550
MLLQAAFILVLSSAFVWVIRRRHRHGLFERLGVPGPKPDFLWGNWKQLKQDRIRVMDQWIQRYGKVFGVYFGDKPFMVVTDVEIIKECFIKAAKVFQDRPMYSIDVEPFKNGLPFLRGEKWREVRSVFNACFTSGKVKKVFDIIDGSMAGLVQKFDEAARFGDIVDAHEASRGMVLEMITKTLLGLEADRRTKSYDPVLSSLNAIFQEADNALFEGAFTYPGLRSILQCLYPFTYFCKAVQKVMDHALITINKRRRDETERKGDVLKHILDAQEGVGHFLPTPPETERKDDVIQHILDAQKGVGNFLPTARTSARLIDDHKLLCNIVVLLMAGLETTSASLAFLLYLLPKHPEEQQKVRAEIHRVLRRHKNSNMECGIINFEEKQGLEQKRCQPRDNVPVSSRSHSSDNPTNASQNYEHEALETKPAERTDMPKVSSHQRSEKMELDEEDVMLLERLDMVVREGMRLYPAIPVAIMRECVADTTILGRFIPEGTGVFAPTWHIRRNPEIWSEPNRFIPDRFSPAQRDIVACSYFPFGLGPRMCVASRLGMVTVKTALYRIITNFEISLTEDIQDPLPVFVDHVIINPAVPIKLRVKRIKLE